MTLHPIGSALAAGVRLPFRAIGVVLSAIVSAIAAVGRAIGAVLAKAARAAGAVLAAVGQAIGAMLAKAARAAGAVLVAVGRASGAVLAKGARAAGAVLVAVGRAIGVVLAKGARAAGAVLAAVGHATDATGHAMGTARNRAGRSFKALASRVWAGPRWLVRMSAQGLSAGLRGLRRRSGDLIASIGGSRALWSLRSKRLVVTLEDDVLRAVLFSGPRVLSWGTVRLETNAAVLPPGLMRQARGRTRTVVDLPFYSTMLRYLALPNVSRKNLAQVVFSEASEALPLSLDNVDLAWRLAPNEPQATVFAAATPRNATDAHLRQIRAFGINPAVVFPREMALAASVGAAAAVVGYVHGEFVDVMFARHGLPRIAHRTTVPPASSAADRAAFIIRGIEEAIAFQEAQESGGIDPDLRVFISGPGYDDPEVRMAVGSALGSQEWAPDQAFEYPDDFPVAEFQPHIGLFLADTRKESHAPHGRNSGTARGALPARHRHRRVTARAVAAAAVVVVLGAGAAGATFKLDDLELGVAQASAQLVELEGEARLERLQRQRTLALQQQLPQVVSQINTLLGKLEALDAGLGTFGSRVRAIAIEERTADIVLSSVGMSSGSIKVAGTADSHQSLVAYTTALRSTGLFVDVRVLSANAGLGGSVPGEGADVVTFQLAVVTDDGLAQDAPQ